MDKSKSSFNTEKGVLKILRGDGGWKFVCVLVALFLQKVCFLLPICLPCVICGSYVMKINAVLRHTARQTFALLGLFALARIACLLQLWVGRRPNKKESLNTARKWEWSASIREVVFLRESLGWTRIKCLLSALTTVHGRFPFTKNFRKLPWKGPSSEECVPFDTSSIRLCVRHQNSRW